MAVTVILERAPHKANVSYEHADKRSAWRQALSLMDLHACKHTETEDTITVHAADTYKPKGQRNHGA